MAAPRVLMVAQGGRTGFARVAGTVLAALHPGCDPVHFVLDVRAPAADRPWPRIGNTVPGDPLGRTQLPGLLGALRPDLVLLVHDPWLYPRLAGVLAGVRAVVYCPVDGPLTRPAELAPLARAARVVTCTRFGRDELARALPDAPPAAVIPHSVDSAAFHPLGHGADPERTEVGPDASRAVDATVFRRARSGPDAFVVLNAHRHSVRKRLDVTIEGFARFADGKPPGVRLHLHSGVSPRTLPDPARYRELLRADRIRHTAPGADFPDLPDAALNRLYNACAVGLNTASAEGFGLVPFEHAATGAPQIVPGHAPCRELWEDAAVLLPADAPAPVPGDHVGHRLVTPGAVAAALETLYTDPSAYADAAARAHRRATGPAFGRPAIDAAWRAVVGAAL
ncbi:hypothetical protein [Actinomadura flavalba]|uniref:hypothetical protein n=1 Tax=Actinomadura flavalba TaxID=1120938 RepID=UPI00036FA99D|nr:hypothetical protein [Actinomadura flavalba]